LQPFAGYAFNRAHAYCYALLAYQTAYFKANYPAEWFAAVLSTIAGDTDKVVGVVGECRRLEVPIRPPDVNTSELEFRVESEGIRFGLAAVKNVGEGAVEQIIQERAANGAYSTLEEFCRRQDLHTINKRVIESLIKCGALDSTEATRWGMLSALEQALSYGQRLQADRMMGQDSLFGGTDEKPTHPPIGSDEYEKPELLRLEKETLGVYVSEHPLTGIRDQLRRKTDCNLSDMERRRDGEVVTVGGIVGAIKQLTTKKGEPMVFMRLDDLTGSTEIVVFNSVYAASRELLVPDRVLVVKGRVDHKQEGETKLIALEVNPFEAMPERRQVELRIDAAKAHAGVVRELAALVRDYPGEAPVVLALETSSGPKRLAFGPEYKVQPVADFFAEVKALLGEAAIA